VPSFPLGAFPDDEAAVVETFTDLEGVINPPGVVTPFLQLDLNSSFQGLDAVEIVANGDPEMVALFDNFVVNQPASGVPDAGPSATFLGLGLTFVAAARRKFIR
jgi:hypothetical protein